MTLRISHIAWLDLETTGSDVEHDEIIEAGIVLTDLRLDEIAAESWLVWPGGNASRRLLRNPVVLKMHTDNGLLQELADKADLSVTAATVDHDIVSWLNSHTKSQRHVALAGSGVGHFDRKFIAKFLPKLDRALTYWHFDTGVFRRTLELARRSDLVPDFNDKKPHRALDDARLALNEQRHYNGVLQSL